MSAFTLKIYPIRINLEGKDLWGCVNADRINPDRVNLGDVNDNRVNLRGVNSDSTDL